MGEWDQPVVGMRSCFDLSDGLEALAHSGPIGRGQSTVMGGWSAREWFVIKQAKVHLSDDGVLIPQVAMGVEARELQHGPHGMEDKPVTHPEHPAVRYAEQFTHYFDLIAERKSAIFHLRELARATLLAKFLVNNEDIRKRMGDSWYYLGADEEKPMAIPSSLEVPQLWNERSAARIEVNAEGEIVDAEEGIERSRHGIYGGAQFALPGADTLSVLQTGPRGPMIFMPQRVTAALPPKWIVLLEWRVVLLSSRAWICAWTTSTVLRRPRPWRKRRRALMEAGPAGAATTLWARPFGTAWEVPSSGPRIVSCSRKCSIPTSRTGGRTQTPLCHLTAARITCGTCAAW